MKKGQKAVHNYTQRIPANEKIQVPAELQDYVNEKMKLVNKQLNKAISKTNNIFASELDTMYRFFIQDFYSYQTTEYIRNGHDVPGMRTGNTLYHGLNLKHSNTHGEGSQWLSFSLEYNGEWGEDPTPEYKFEDDPQDVLDLVIRGVRFGLGNVAGSDTGGRTMLWRAPQYNGKYWNYTGDINAVFNKIAQNHLNIQWAIFTPIWQECIDTELVTFF